MRSQHSCTGRPETVPKRDEPAIARRHVVEIRGFEYQPGRLRVAVGDTLVWINRDPVPHTATRLGGGWDSGPIAAGGAWSRVVTPADRSRYTCTLHPATSGEIIVR